MKTDTAIKVEGMKILMANLGYVDAERFVMLMNKEPFDYTKWRDKNLESKLTVRELSSKAMDALND